MELRPATEYAHDADIIHCEPWGSYAPPEPRREYTRCRKPECGKPLHYRNTTGYCAHGNCTPRSMTSEMPAKKRTANVFKKHHIPYIYSGKDGQYGRMAHYRDKLDIANKMGYPDVSTAIEAVYAETKSSRDTAAVFQMTPAGMTVRLKLMGLVIR